MTAQLMRLLRWRLIVLHNFIMGATLYPVLGFGSVNVVAGTDLHFSETK
jgi:hypothetical protein